MAKDKKKKRKKPAPKPGGLRPESLFEKRRSTTDPMGDLRLVGQHLQAYLDGEPAGLELVQRMGRDASHPALAFAEQSGDAELLTLARRLVAVPPEVKTNLFELREEAVEAQMRTAAGAPELGGLVLRRTGNVALFDPSQVKKALVQGGRPRNEPDARSKGALLSFGFGVGGEVEVHFHLEAPPEPRPGALGRLRVGSGLVAVGAPEASDGPRIGTVRLDPQATALDAAHAAGTIQFARLAPGVYAARAWHSGPDRLEVFLYPDPEPNRPLDYLGDPSLSAVPAP